MSFCCVICAADRLRYFDAFKQLRRVTSDCKAFPAGGQLALCEQCGTVQKIPDATWQAEIAAIYADYEAYAQSQGEEQVVFDQSSGASCKRSVKLSQFIRDSRVLPETNGKVLDYGCANGEFLATFSNDWPGWRLHGADLTRKYESRLQSITRFDHFYQPADLPAASFDLITLIHVLEHLAAPVETLLQLKKSLTPNGCLLIQVPNLREIPHDILIADHLTHFTVETLSLLLARAGLQIKVLSTSAVTKEISVLAAPQAAPCSPPQQSMAYAHRLIENHLQFLTAMLEDATALEKRGEFAIFGSSIAATWLASHFDHVIGFVDEDLHRMGIVHEGKRIYGMGELASDLPIYVALPFATAHAIVSRLADKRLLLPRNITASVFA